MNNRTLSYGLLLSIAALMAACGGDPQPADGPPQPSTTATDTPPPPSATADATPPPTATATAAPEPPPPPAKPAKEKFAGKFQQQFAGEVKDAADAAAKKAAGKADKDGKKYNAAMEKAQKAVEGNIIENTADTLKWSVGGKAAHEIKFEADAKGDPNALTIKLGKDGKKDLKGQEVSITFKDDNTFEMKDPFSKKDAKTLVFKRQ